MALPNWLSQLCLLSDFDGNWDAYFEELYRRFYENYIRRSLPDFDGERVSCKRHPETDGKSATFWHLISEGLIEANRTPDMRRCERICWAREILENAQTEHVKRWDVKRRSETRTCLWCEEAEFLVVLARRSGYSLLWTAYTVTEPHRKRTLAAEYKEFWAQKGRNR